MTSPTTRRQRQYDRQTPIPQPIFAPPLTGPSAPKIDWNQRLQQGYQARQTERRQNFHGQYEGMGPVAGPLALHMNKRLRQGHHVRLPEQQQNHHGQYEGMAPVAGLSTTIQGRVDWNKRLLQGYQVRH